MPPRNPFPPIEDTRLPPELDEDGHCDVTDDADTFEPDYDDPEYNGRCGPRPAHW